MQIALGTTVLQRGLNHNSLDGIGVYTQALLEHLKHYPNLTIEEVAFRQFGESVSNTLLPGYFHLEIMRSVLTGLSFNGASQLKKKIALFHATDHYIPKLRDVPVIATLMDPVPLMRPDWVSLKARRLKNWLFRQSAQWASHYITISNAVVPDLVEHFGIAEEKITPIHLGVNVSDFAPLSEQKKEETLVRLKLSPNFFLFIGTLQPRKNVGKIIEAFEQLPKEVQKAFPLVVVGREGWCSQNEVEKLKKLIAQGVAHWLGYVTFIDKVALLQTASALVFPSLYEGFGLPVLEAFASRLPVITSNTSSLPEVAGDSAYLIDPLDAEAIAEAMKRVIVSSELLQDKIESGYKRASEMTWARCVEKTFDVYRGYM